MNDFDRRLEAMEKKIADQKPVNDSCKFHLFLFRAQFSNNSTIMHRKQSMVRTPLRLVLTSRIFLMR
jgi:hypothetical protein